MLTPQDEREIMIHYAFTCQRCGDSQEDICYKIYNMKPYCFPCYHEMKYAEYQLRNME